MPPLTCFCPWKHWFWITNNIPSKTMDRSARTSHLVLLIFVAHLLSVAQSAPVPIGAVDTKSITFKKLALNDNGAQDGKGVEKLNLPVASMISSGRKSLKAPPVEEGNSEDSRVLVTIATTTVVANSPASTTEIQSSSTLATKSVITDENQEETEIIELSASDPDDDNATDSVPESREDEARIMLVSESPAGISIEDSEKKIDGQNIQNLVLQDEEDSAVDALEGNGNKSRKSKGLLDGADAPELRPEARLQAPLNSHRSTLIQFSDNDRLELLSSQNHALTSEDLEPRARTSNVGLISGISLSVLSVFCVFSLVGAMLYRRRYTNKPQTLSEPDSSGYIDDSIIRENSDELYSLDNDSFLNSLEAMTIQNYWTDHVKHTKL